jgi:hypothetical protein
MDSKNYGNCNNRGAGIEQAYEYEYLYSFHCMAMAIAFFGLPSDAVGSGLNQMSTIHLLKGISV